MATVGVKGITRRYDVNQVASERDGEVSNSGYLSRCHCVVFNRRPASVASEASLIERCTCPVLSR